MLCSQECSICATRSMAHASHLQRSGALTLPRHDLRHFLVTSGRSSIFNMHKDIFQSTFVQESCTLPSFESVGLKWKRIFVKGDDYCQFSQLTGAEEEKNKTFRYSFVFSRFLFPDGTNSPSHFDCDRCLFFFFFF